MSEPPALTSVFSCERKTRSDTEGGIGEQFGDAVAVGARLDQRVACHENGADERPDEDGCRERPRAVCHEREREARDREQRTRGDC